MFWVMEASPCRKLLEVTSNPKNLYMKVTITGKHTGFLKTVLLNQDHKKNN